MLKRLNIYFKEMFPLIPRLILGFIIFGEIYFIILLNSGVKEFSLGIQEIVGGFTVFSFLLWLRIADDFKDYELDCRLFAHRPLPSGRVEKRDLRVFATGLIACTAVLNVIFMNNIMFFALLYLYGSLMAIWFFQKHKIAKSLPLALVPHNPVQFILNLYIVSFTCIKYNLPAFTLTNFLAICTLYFPALIWEISRKIRAPKDETEYVTYSKLFGIKKTVSFILILTLVDIITNILLIIRLNVPTLRTNPELLDEYITIQAANEITAHDRIMSRKTRQPWLVKRARCGIKNRESSRLDRCRIYGVAREILLKIGAQLTLDGLINDKEDVFWLELAEIRALLHTPLDCKAVIAHKKSFTRAMPPFPLILAWYF